MAASTCTVSFFRNDVQGTRLQRGQCPVKGCCVDIKNDQAPYQQYKGKMIYLPFCPEHGIRIHKGGFVYYNGSSRDARAVATRRNLMFNPDYYLANFLEESGKVGSGRLCYESSEDAVSYNVFTELLAERDPLRKLAAKLTGGRFEGDVELYLWGGRIDLESGQFSLYKPLEDVRDRLERDIRGFATEPDIMLVVPGEVLICIEAKFGSKNPIADHGDEKGTKKQKKPADLIERYCPENGIIDAREIFDLSPVAHRLYEQLFRNLVFAASMAEIAGIKRWHVVNLRSRHVMNLKRGKPESMPVLRAVRSLLRPKFKKRFSHVTWEDIYDTCICKDSSLHNLSWYMKNKTLSCRRAFNIL